MERRKTGAGKFTPLPTDYLKMLNEVLTSNFSEGLKGLKQIKGAVPRFEAGGQIYPDEVVVSATLLFEDQIAATTVYVSSDFDPKASSPTLEDLLSMCVDALGALFGQLFGGNEPEALEKLADETLASLEDIPFNWTAVTIERRSIFMKVDKANPKLDQMANDWLEKHDPDLKKLAEDNEKATEALFITGPKKKKP